MSKLDGRTLDIEEENIEKLKQLFPEVDTDGKIDFEKLKQVLGEYIEDSEERYKFSWNGKGEALRLSQTPSMGTLRPVPEEGESKDWDNTENLYIEGDNLEVLKLLQKSYFGKIKMIYIDPPYNTGNDFVYKDNYKESIKNYNKITGQVDNEGKTISTNPEHSGRYHTDWLNMIFPRLRLAKNLLTEDGFIFISIGQHESHNLIKICDEIFGESNRLGVISRVMKSGGGKGQFFSPNIDYVLTYSKNITKAKNFRAPVSQKTLKNYYKNIEIEGERKGELYGEERISVSGLDVRPNQRYWIECPDGSFVIPTGSTLPDEIEEGKQVLPIDGDGCWKWIYSTYKREKDLGNIIFKITSRSPLVDENGEKSKYNLYNKVWLDDKEGSVPGNLISLFENRISSAELKELNIPFDFAKPSHLIKYLISIINDNENSIILDFFSGSSTTAHAVMDLNTEDNGNRKFIMVQLPEPTDEKSEANKAGYEHIAEIGKERIRRAGDKIKSELEEKYEKASEEERKDMKNPEELDIGFKVFKLSNSNIKEWNPGKYDDIQLAIEDALNPYVEGRTEEDVVYEMILKMGLDLTYPVEKHEVNGKIIYSVGYALLMICLSDSIDSSIAKKMIEIKDENNQNEFRVIFRDAGFKSDTDKTNIKETLKSVGIADESFITL